MIVHYTPKTIKRDIDIINALRNNPNTRGIYATVTGGDYADYLRWYKEWLTLCENPVIMEENSIGENKYELDFSFMPTDNTIGLIRLYLSATCHWKHIVADCVEHRLKLTIEG